MSPGPGGLITYRHLGAEVDADGTGTMALRPDLRSVSGGLLASPVAILAGLVAALSPGAPAVASPVHESVHLLDPGIDVEAVAARCPAVHAGRTLVFSETDVTDARDPRRVLAVVRLSSVTASAAGGVPARAQAPGDAPGRADAARSMPARTDAASSMPARPDLPPLPVAFGARQIAAGWELPALDDRVSAGGSLHQGPIQILLEAAAFDLAAAAAGTDRLQVDEWSVAFLRPGRTGPFRTSGGVVDGPGGRLACRVVLSEAWDVGRIVASALAVFAPSDRS